MFLLVISKFDNNERVGKMEIQLCLDQGLKLNQKNLYWNGKTANPCFNNYQELKSNRGPNNIKKSS